MPRIFDNIELPFLPALEEMLSTANAADFCVGYFNLRGWKSLGAAIEERFTGEGNNRCRVLIGMATSADEELRKAYSLLQEETIDNARVIQLRRKVAEQFKKQLTIGAPTAEDERGLQALARQLRSGKVVVKLFLRQSLHAKLYLVHRSDAAAPLVGFVGSSNLTFAGLMKQYELNVDVVDGDAAQKLSKWFDERWQDRWCIDITAELADIIEESWARPTLISPYHIYLNIAYHLAQEARAGLAEFKIPREFGDKLFDYQVAAVKIAAHHLNNDKRKGVILGDVVGLGKTLMATALARIFEDDLGYDTLIICPKNLKPMWEAYADTYRLRAKVMKITEVAPGRARSGASTSTGSRGLQDLRRYRLIIIDESHNLRNREGHRYRAIHQYIEQNECRCILLSATPYNKAFLDLGAQLRLFVPEHQDLGVRPDALLREVGEVQFQAMYQCPVRSIAAFEKSNHADDWRDLMRLFMVRRTRGFIKENYTLQDPDTGRRYLLLENGDRSYFPDRVPRTIEFKMSASDGDSDPYARLYSPEVVDAINGLNLPRYGLGNYVLDKPITPPTASEAKIIGNLSRAGKRLMGFCRTNLFKRLESSGLAFILSLERHLLRNYVFMHAINNELPLPIGTTDPGMLDTDNADFDADEESADLFQFDSDEPVYDADDAEAAETAELNDWVPRPPLCTVQELEQRAAAVYEQYATRYRNYFKWLKPQLLTPALLKDLRKDSDVLANVLAQHGTWNPGADLKLQELLNLISQEHKSEKVLVFSQFADTVNYLTSALKRSGVSAISGATGGSTDPTMLAWRFSPVSNGVRERITQEQELRVLISTDVLSEGQNLQDCHIVVNFDLPWAIIRLIQRAGRVDRIGQAHDKILCYSFYPMLGVDKIIKLRNRIRQRLTENAEVVGADELFFEDMKSNAKYRDLYNEKSGVLDDEDDNEVDISSQALQIWKNATDKNPELRNTIENMPDVVFSAKMHAPESNRPAGALIYLRTADGTDALAWVDDKGEAVTESPLAILRAAACEPSTPAVEKAHYHHGIVRKGVQRIVEDEANTGGQLGRQSGARFKTYERLKAYANRNRGSLFVNDELVRTIDDIYRYPLRQSAADSLNRQLRSGIGDEALAELCVALRSDDRLCLISEDHELAEPRIICSMGLVEANR